MGRVLNVGFTLFSTEKGIDDIRQARYLDQRGKREPGVGMRET